MRTARSSTPSETNMFITCFYLFYLEFFRWIMDPAEPTRSRNLIANTRNWYKLDTTNKFCATNVKIYDLQIQFIMSWTRGNDFSVIVVKMKYLISLDKVSPLYLYRNNTFDTYFVDSSSTNLINLTLLSRKTHRLGQPRRAQISRWLKKFISN